jgi:hypothetical protein
VGIGRANRANGRKGRGEEEGDANVTQTSHTPVKPPVKPQIKSVQRVCTRACRVVHARVQTDRVDPARHGRSTDARGAGKKRTPT